MKTKITHLLVTFIAILVISPITAQTANVSAITQDTTWSGTIQITGNITASYFITLTIMPGTTIKFLGNYSFEIPYGKVIAAGTAIKPITFTTDNADTTNGWNEFYCIQPLNSTDSSIFNYCNFKYISGSGLFFYNYSNVRVSNCTFTKMKKSGKGLYLHNSNILFSNCTFQNNSSTGDIALMTGSNPTFISNNFSGNSTSQHILYISESNPVFQNNTFYKNTGILFYLLKSSPNFIGNKICNNSGNYIFEYYSGSGGNVINNLIANNAGVSGGAIYLSGSSPFIINNTIAYNAATYGGAIYSDANSNAQIYNTIFWGNTATIGANAVVYLNGVHPSPDFYNCTIQGYPSSWVAGVTFAGTLQSDTAFNPLFITSPAGSGTSYNALSYNWALNTSIPSPAINKGASTIPGIVLPQTDIAGNNRVSNSKIDLGAYENYIANVTPSCPINLGNTEWIADTVYINCNVTVNAGQTLTIDPGTVVVFKGNYSITVLGVLKALGTATKNIYFTKITPTDTIGFYNTSNSNGGWAGVIFDNSSSGANGLLDSYDSSQLVYCNFKYIKKSSAIYVDSYNKLVVNHCTFSNNNGTVDGLGVYCRYSNIAIKNSTFYNNKSSGYGAAIACEGGGNVKLSNLYVVNNTISTVSGSPLFISGANAIVENCLIANNTGGGVYFQNSNSTVVNCNIINNLSLVGSISYALALQNSNITLANSVIRGNKWGTTMSQYYFADYISQLNVINCNFQGAPGVITNYPENTYQNVFDSIPVFINPSNGIGSNYNALSKNWNVLSISPNINAGTTNIAGYTFPTSDIAGNPRLNNGKIDIGAFQAQGSIVKFTKQPVGGTLCIGSQISFSVAVSDTAKYQWYKDGTLISGANASAYNINSISAQNSGVYSCAVSNSYGSVYSNSIALQVNTPPSVLSQPNPVWVNLNSSTQLKTSFNGSSPIHYQWYKNNVVLTNDTNANKRFTSFGYSNEGAYYCTAGNSCGSASTQPVSLYVAPQITNSTGSNVCQGSSFQINVAINDTVDLQWQKNGNNITGATSKTLTLSSVDVIDQGNYSCIVSNANEYTVTNPVLLQILLKPVITNNPTGSLVLKGVRELLSASATGNKPLSYQWTLDGKNLLNDTLSTIKIDSFINANEGKYVCHVTNSCGTVASTPATLSLVPQICMVSVSDTTDKSKTGHNKIIWNKESKVQYAKFNVYRESAAAGFYDQIGSVAYSQPGIFVDSAVNPQEQAFLYKITGVDSSNNETDINLCPVSKTIHLLTTYGVQGGIQLEWDQYIGFSYKTYYIYRGINRKGFKMVKEIASTNRTWTDLDTVIGPHDTLSYFVSVKRLNGCTPNKTGLKAGDGMLVESVSNMEDNRLRTGTSIKSPITRATDVNVYPNPFPNSVTIEYNLKTQANVTLKIYDLLGNQVVTLIDADTQTGLNKTTFSPSLYNLKLGIYILELNYNGKVTQKKLVYTK